MVPTFSLWFQAARPKTLPAAAIPVAVGAALAARQGPIEPLAVLLCLVFSLLVQCATNFSNDYQDFIRGADTEDRRGPQRMVAAGLISPGAMALAAKCLFAAAFVTGLGLIPFRDFYLLPIGILSVAAGYAYTGGPRPLAYHALGDLFVLVFFGWVAVGATEYVLSGVWSREAWIAGTAVGLLAVNLLVVNNTRDIETDGPAGKRTLAVRIGEYASKRQYGIQAAIAHLLTLPLAFLVGSWGPLIGLLSAAWALPTWEQFVRASDGPSFNRILGSSAGILLLHGLLLVGGLLLIR